MRRAKILIVEDEAIVADNIKNNLEKHGYKIASLAASGEMALQITEKENPDLVLMDIVLKGDLDGINAADQIHKQFGIPVIFLTALSEDAIFQSAKTTEPFGYITKPYEIKQLVMSIEIALYKSEMEKEKEKLIHELKYEINERKQSEDALRESQKRFQALTESTYDFIWEIDANGVYIYCSPQSHELWGYKPEDMIGRTPFDLMIPEDREHAIKMFRTISESPSAFKGMETSSYDNSGRIIVVETSGVPFFDIDGKLLGYRGISHDITERKKAEEEIINLSKFPAENPNPVLRINVDGKILYRNEAVDSILKKVKLSRKQIYKILPKNFKNLIKKALETDEIMPNIDVQVNTRIYSYSFAPIIKNQYVNLYGKDITERKKAEEELISNQNKLRSLASELSKTEEQERQRIASYLHDHISQSLAALRINIDELKEIKDCKLISEKAGHIQSMLGKILEDSRTLTFDLSPPILHELGFEPAVEWIVEKMSEDFNVPINFENDAHPKPVERDIGMFLYRSTKECLNNAVKHAQAHSIKVTIIKEDDGVTLTIKDDGIGFDTSKLKSLTDPVGFGLFSIRERIEYIGGNLLIESESGKGTRIIMSVPIKDS